MAHEINARTVPANHAALHRAAVLIIVVLSLVAGLSVVTCAYPHFPGTADIIGQPEMNAVTLSVAPESGVSFTISRAVTSRLDVSLQVQPEDLFIPSLHAVLINAFGLVTIGVNLAPHAVTAIAGLFLGPVRIDWARNWITEARWGLITWSPRPGMSVAAGMAWGNTSARLIGKMTLFNDMRWIAISLIGTEVRITVGGLF